MLRRFRMFINKIPIKMVTECQNKYYSERRRRKGDGTKTDIFEEKSAANQDEYFRRETARQLEIIREKLKNKKTKNKSDDKKNNTGAENKKDINYDEKKNNTEIKNDDDDGKSK